MNRTLKVALTMLLFGLGVVAIQAQPDWAVNTQDYEASMTVVGIIEIDDVELRSENDRVGIFSGITCRGVGVPIYEPFNDRYFIVLSAYGGLTQDSFTYKIYQDSNGQIYEGGEKIGYASNALVGLISNPYIFYNEKDAVPCAQSTAPSVSYLVADFCSGDSTTVFIQSGDLNDATEWKWYNGDCGETVLGSGDSIRVLVQDTTRVYVRGEGGCVLTSPCTMFEFIVRDTIRPTATCIEDKNEIINANCAFMIVDYRSNIMFSDNCTIQPSLEQKPAPGTLIERDTTVTIIVTDTHGNKDSCTFQIHLITGREDLTIDANVDQSICRSTQTVLLEGIISDSEQNTRWTTSGTGSFSDSASLSATYTFSEADIMADSLIFYLSSPAPVESCPNDLMDSVVVHLVDGIAADANVDQIICGGDTIFLNGQVMGTLSHQWSSLGTGVFSNSDSLITYYIPSLTDIENSAVNLVLSANSEMGACVGSTSDTMEVKINPIISVSANDDQTICPGQSLIQLQGQLVGGTSSTIWQSNGTGDFADPSSLMTSYTLSSDDMGLDTIVFILVLDDSTLPCIFKGVDTVLVLIDEFITIDAGEDQIYCEQDTVFIKGQTSAIVETEWTSSGTGVFGMSADLETYYLPSAADQNSGIIDLILSATAGGSSCFAPADTMQVVFLPTVIVSANNDQTICAGNKIVMINGMVTGATNIAVWTTSGTGTFENPQDLVTIYQPSVADSISGEVRLALTLNIASNDCSIISDTMILTLVDCDLDNDGFNADIDCSDNDPNINPDAVEIPNNDIDENCDGEIEFYQAMSLYVNDFNIVTDDFRGNGFSVITPSGFENPGIHSLHPYGEGQTMGQNNFNLTYLLKYPIIVGDVDHHMKFDEIVLVEPGTSGSVFNEMAFKDYVIVEGLKLGTDTWVPLLDGYDASNDTEWSELYTGSIGANSTLSEGEGNSSLFKNRLIDIADSFNVNDTIVIRFRLHSDQAGHGWGWAIDNLEIQNGEVTSINPILGITQFNIFPNPTSGNRINVLLELKNGARDIDLRLFDISGKLLYKRDAFIFGGPNYNNIDLDISNFKSGMYCITLQDENTISTKRFVVYRK